MVDNIEIVLDEAEVSAYGERIRTICADGGENLDADEGIFLARELLFEKAGEIDRVYPDLKARQVIPIASDIDEGADSYKYTTYDRRGQSKIVTDYDTKLPTFDVVAGEVFAKLVTHAGAFRYSIQELARAARARKPLLERKRAAANWGIRKTENTLLFLGSAADNIGGFLNGDGANGGVDLGVPTITLESDSSDNDKRFNKKTPKQIVRDLAALISGVRTQSKRTEEPNTILLPETVYGYINSTPFGVDSERTILSWFLLNNPGVEIGWLLELETAGDGVDTRAIVYRRDPSKVAGQVVIPYRELPPQPDNLHFKVPCYAKGGGTDWLYPLSGAYADGI